MGKGMIAFALLAAAAASSASGFHDSEVVPGPEPRRDPYKPQTRYRRAGLSPAQRLLERQRAQRAAR